jgi:hypothetical protein
MRKHQLVGWTLLLLACSGGYAVASSGCDEQFMTSLQQCERIVGSLRYDKLSQARVFASDGSVYTAGQAQWMKGRLRLIAQECAHGDSVAAVRDLAEVQQILREHHSSLS